MNKELIEQIRNGKALHYDIDNVELLNEVCYEAGDCQPISYKGKYYLLGKYFWYHTDLQPAESIKLSDFLPKMISVEAVREKLQSIRVDEEAYKVKGQRYAYGVTDTINELLTFLNEHTNVK